MNSYNCSGNVTRDPEGRDVNDSRVVKFGIAVNGRILKKNGETVKDENGYTQKEVVFLDCEAWGPQALTIEQYVTKGKKLGLTGEIKQDNWEDKETGAKRSRHFLRVERFEFLDGSKDVGGDVEEPKAAPAGKTKGRPKKAPVQVVDEIPDTSEIPF